MSENSHQSDIVSYIEALHASRHLIAEAYCDGSISIDDENSRQLRNLQQLRIMRSHTQRENSLRLAPDYMKLFDKVVSRFRLMMVSSDLSSQMTRLHALVEGFQTACEEGQEENREAYGDDFDFGAYEISDAVDEMIMHVDIITNNNFANVDSYPEKIRQNTHYLAEMKRLVETLSVINDPALLDILQSSREVSPLLDQYEHHLLDKMNAWRAKLHDIITLLERYLAKMRTIEPYAKRIRTLSIFLHKNPNYKPREPEDYPYIPDWAYRDEGLKLTAHPDVMDESQEEALIPIAKSIENIKNAIPRERKAGTLADDDETPRVKVIEPTPFERAVMSLSSQVKDHPEGLSAIRYLRTHELTKEIDLSVSLMCLALMLENKKKRKQFSLESIAVTRRVLPEPDALSGNIIIEDLLLCPSS